MKKLTVLLLCALLVLTSCAPSLDDEDEVLQNEEDTEVETSIVPGSRLGEETYRMILPYRTSEARGIITNQVANRVDIDEMEEGLRRHSVDVFDPEDYYFQEGRYLDESTVISWIDELNPDRPENLTDWDKETNENNPRIFSHILEQNYLLRSGEEDDNTVQVAGISIGIALKSVYRYQLEQGGDYFYYDVSMNEMLAKGYEIAETVVERLRESEDVPDVPILISLYREEAQNSPVPGNYVTKTLVPSGDNTIGNWEDIDEEYILFPSNKARSEYITDYENFNNFGNKIAEFFPNYVGAIGSGFYVDGELQRLTIEVPIEFYGKAEVIGFTQYAYDRVQDIFPNYYDLEINVTSSNNVESLIYRNAKEEQPTIHIYH
ncbi:CamS family sex pheromone protein [Oceanobacillus alkalisoli]|uniref:CamS family sex pheromone protein n=1 Tax=Oceanobacillus alkalisoli TaxID=2925113 RepID=UPI001F121EDA|nr:CamS family sex pheromone protein [Oceanobacillus alkalisoli]MCF3944930.1 CamS family sex pheromone protein [Oceanobacillus alkalisoli]